MPGVLGSVLAGFGVSAIIVEYTIMATVVAVAGVVLLTVGGLRGIRQLALTGVGLLLAAIVLAGVFGIAAGAALAAGVLTALAWDLQHNAFSLGKQVGRSASTIRAELTHGGATLLGGTIVAGVAYGIFLMSPGGWPMSAVILAILGGFLLVLALEL